MSNGRVVRVASGQGFWGDDLEAPVRQVEGGPIDYLMLDYLAEVTMSIMQKQRARDPNAGYARDFVSLMQRIFPACIKQGVRVVTNAGGVTPRGCAEALAEALDDALECGKPMLITMHKRSRNPLLQSIRKRDDLRTLEVTRINASLLPSKARHILKTGMV